MKPKKCKACKQPFTPQRPLQRACSLECSIILVEEDKAKKSRKATTEKKVSLRSRRDWMKLAQQAFNAFIRERDKKEPCICCGRFATSDKYGGMWDAGHFLTRGAYPELKFDEDNCHRQLKSCNAGSGKFAAKQKTVSESYRIRLIEKIGIERVERLEGPHPPRKWTIEDLQEIRETYKSKLRELVRAEKNSEPSFYDGGDNGNDPRS